MCMLFWEIIRHFSFCTTPNSTLVSWFSKPVIVCCHHNNANFVSVILYTHHAHCCCSLCLLGNSWAQSGLITSTFHVKRMAPPIAFSKFLPISKTQITLKCYKSLLRRTILTPYLCASMLNFSPRIMSIKHITHIHTGTYMYCVQMFTVISDGFV